MRAFRNTEINWKTLKRAGAGDDNKPGDPNSAMQSSDELYAPDWEILLFLYEYECKYFLKGNSNSSLAINIQTQVKPCHEPLQSLQEINKEGP